MREFRISIAFCIATLATTTPLSAKTLVFCSEGSPENFYPAINTTGTSFDANGQIYSRIFRRTARLTPSICAAA
jgi:dipeptide transport system substrate-binding protein